MPWGKLATQLAPTVCHISCFLTFSFFSSNSGQYKSLQSLRQDMELMCLNAAIFNKVGDEFWCEARRFWESCTLIIDRQIRKSQPTAYGAELVEIVKNYDETKKVNSAHGDKNSFKRRRQPREMDGGYGRNAHEREKKELQENTELLNSEPSTTVVADLSSSEGPTTKEGDEMENTNRDATPSVAQSAAIASLEDEIATVILPPALSPLPEPTSFSHCSAAILSAEESFFSCFQDQCLVCGSAGLSELLIFCIDCSEAFHSFCVDISFPALSPLQRMTWRCSNCKVSFCSPFPPL